MRPATPLIRYSPSTNVLPSTAKNRTRVHSTGAAATARPACSSAPAASPAARSCAQSISIALATIVATTTSSASSSGPNTPGFALSITTTPTSCPSTMAGTATWLSASARPGQRDLATRHLAAVLLVRAPDGARVREHPPEVADPHRLGTVGDHADDAVAHPHLGPDAFARVAVAGDGEQALAVFVEEEQQRVLVAEQLGQARQRRAHERVEIGAPGQALAQTAPACGPVRRRRAARRSRVRHVDRSRHRLELDHPVDVGAAQLEDALHPGERGDGVDVAPQPLEHGPPAFGAFVHAASCGTSRR